MTKIYCRLLWLFGFVMAWSHVSCQQIAINKDNRTISISTSDSATTDAEVAQIHIGFNAYAADAKTVYLNASDISASILNALARVGVANTAIQSDVQNISEQMAAETPVGLPEAERQRRRFEVSQTWTVTSSAKEAGNILSIAISAGGNNSGQIEWSVKDEDALQATAAARALQHARAIAEQMAKGLNATLGTFVYASNQTPLNRQYPLMAKSSSVSVLDREVKPMGIIPQKVTKFATVYAVFALQ